MALNRNARTIEFTVITGELPVGVRSASTRTNPQDYLGLKQKPITIF